MTVNAVDRIKLAAKEWEDFWTLATSLAKRKEAKLKPAKEKEARVAIRHWMKLYYRRWDSILQYENFKFAPTPNGAWDRVGEYGMSDNGDSVYDSNCYGKHGSPLYNGWVLDNSVPNIQRTSHDEHYDDEDPPILQVLKIGRILPSNYVGLALSDGDFVVLGILHRRLEYLLKKLRKFTIVKVQEHRMEYKRGSPIVWIESLEVWNDVISSKIRNPKVVAQYGEMQL